MELIKDISMMQNRCREEKLKGRKIGFVPTMGALHKGHLALIQKAREDCDFVVVSIFVNPTQFGAGEDFERYPRDLSKDLRLCEEEGVDVVFAPSVQDMYPEDFSTWVEVKGRLTETLEGSFRPGHFRGVTTVVAKLFNIVSPDVSYFGRKDYQQALIVKKMVRELNIATQIVLLPTVREEDGLASSSRNKYLSDEERKKARVLYRSLLRAKTEIEDGEDNPSRIISSMKDLIREEGPLRIDYIAIVDPDTLEPVERIEGKVLIAIAAQVGKTRLIDNIIA
ncbi:pantoate--beta-alanine ligase [Candidatus Aerophobetes bacterium]|uniref:Pantothenate synthetase n=1 Tax=Aerophobetes bacterium TaxID=2030807 RepID=A0A662DHH0_UNCAE|nr:MAG: pantoate--beta-alanine ligase [Candidatus Aerophobetes bacterium]